MPIEKLVQGYKRAVIAGSLAGLGALAAVGPAQAQAPYCIEKYPGDPFSCRYYYEYYPYYSYYPYYPYPGYSYGYYPGSAYPPYPRY